MTPRREKFCQEIVKVKSQSDAYRVAFQSIRANRKTVREKASRLRKQPSIDARITEIMAPVLAKIQVTKEQWLKTMERFYYADVRKLFDAHGHPIAIHLLGDNEAAFIEGFEMVEDVTKVTHEDGSTEAVCTGCWRKYKFTSHLKAMMEFGKVMGFYSEKHVLEGTLTLEQLILGSYARRAERNAKEVAV